MNRTNQSTAKNGLSTVHLSLARIHERAVFFSLISCLAITLSLLSCNKNDGPPVSSHELIEITQKADSGDIKAQIQLGEIFLHGLSGNENPEQAAKWFQMAAEAGDENAQYQLALLHDEKRLPSSDEATAFKWYKIASENGHVEATLVTAFSYEFGLGTEKNLTLAHLTYAKASEAKMMQELEEKMTEQQIADARKMYDDWVNEFTEQLNDISEGKYD